MILSKETKSYNTTDNSRESWESQLPLSLLKIDQTIAFFKRSFLAFPTPALWSLPINVSFVAIRFGGTQMLKWSTTFGTYLKEELSSIVKPSHTHL